MSRSKTHSAIAPPGFSYRPELLSEREAFALTEALAALDWERGAFRLRGRLVRRRELHFLHDYNRHTRGVVPGPPLPAALEELRGRMASALGLQPDVLEQGIAALYRPGAGIAWHVDSVRAFGEVVCGLSLGADAVMRFRPRGSQGPVWRTVLEPRSFLSLEGPARYEFEHEIRPVTRTRYSVTFRNLRA